MARVPDGLALWIHVLWLNPNDISNKTIIPTKNRLQLSQILNQIPMTYPTKLSYQQEFTKNFYILFTKETSNRGFNLFPYEIMSRGLNFWFFLRLKFLLFQILPLLILCFYVQHIATHRIFSY
jgi:hypothetical protein